MTRIPILAAVVALGFCARDTQAASARILTHTYGKGPSAVLVTLVDILPAGPVRILTSSPSARVRRKVSHAQFERMWATLMASEGRKLQAPDPSKTVDGVHNYVFSLAEVPDRSGRFVVPKNLLVPKSVASPAVAGVARQIREVIQE